MLTFISLAVLTVAGALLGFMLDIRWLLPLLEAAPAFVFLVRALRTRGRATAIGLMIWWAFCLGVTDVSLAVLWHGRAETAVFNAVEYRAEMTSWITTGVGRESTPSMFIPQHLWHAGAFCLLSLVTGGALSLVMGSILMNYMGFYVGDLILRCSATPNLSAAVALAWNPWSMVRVVSFIILGVTLAEPLLSRLPGTWPDPAARWRWIALGVGGLGLDMLLKTLLAPHWPALLVGCFAS